MEAWNSQPTFTDSWMSEAFAKDTDILSRALQKSFSDDPFFPLFDMIKPESTALPTSSVSGSEPEPDIPAHKRRINAVSNGKITKRKSRASKKSTTTFINADPANFRQMVQHVTGVRQQLPIAPVLKPEPHRALNQFQACLPTLDTSAFLLDHHHQVEMDSVYQLPYQLPVAYTPVEDDGGPYDFESFSGFPTLESGKVM